jgi:hypothetical protein
MPAFPWTATDEGLRQYELININQPLRNLFGVEIGQVRWYLMPFNALAK